MEKVYTKAARLFAAAKTIPELSKAKKKFERELAYPITDIAKEHINKLYEDRDIEIREERRKYFR